MKLLNLGCGSSFHPDWVNVDMASTRPGVIAHDLRRPLPFADQTFDAVYHSHVLEHFPREDGERFMRESLRVLKSGGTIRVAVPDLERLTRAYLEKLEAAERGEAGAEEDYEWLLLELFDQMVRRHPGGLMKEYLAGGAPPNKQYVCERIGLEGEQLMQPATRAPKSALEKIVSKHPVELARLARNKLTEAAVLGIGGAAAHRSFREGVFRDSGEVHRWMYDRHSLRRLLEKCGAGAIEIRDAFQSRITSFAAYGLDAVEGRVRKPDSLFMEGVKRD